MPKVCATERTLFLVGNAFDVEASAIFLVEVATSAGDFGDGKDGGGQKSGNGGKGSRWAK